MKVFPEIRRARFFLVAAGLAAVVACAKRKPATAPEAQPAPVASAGPERGMASWYGGNDGFVGKPTSSGEIFDDRKLTAAHRTLPLGTWVDVRNESNGKSVRVRVNDRGPFVAGRILDLSREAARQLDAIGPGVIPVSITVVAPGPAVLAVSSTGRWSVQIGSFASAFGAETLAAKVRATGRRVSTQPYDGLTRVKVGPYASRAEASQELARLEAERFEGIVVPEN